ncbi:Aspartic peptidase domain containing protein, partial [Hyaloscypha variabilis]
ITAQIGSPPQTVYVQLDTGSNELWVYSNCDESDSPSICADFGIYDPTKSSTSTDTEVEFGITYGKGSVNGIYYIDTVALAGISLPTTQFGVATTSSALFDGIMGVSFGYPYNTLYYNVIDKLYADGKTNSKLFSLGLGSATTAEGEIVFGGIDTMKYSGYLALIPILFPGPDGSYRYWVNLNSLGNTQPGASSSNVYTVTDYSLSVILDSGTTLSYIPQALFNLVLADFPEAAQQSSGIYSVPCSYVTESGTIDFGFGNMIIHVPYSQFIYQPSAGSCYLGFLPSASGNIPILGDTFLRGAYVVYDQSQTSIYLANYVNCGSSLVAVPAGYGAASAFKGQC